MRYLFYKLVILKELWKKFKYNLILLILISKIKNIFGLSYQTNYDRNRRMRHKMRVMIITKVIENKIMNFINIKKIMKKRKIKNKIFLIIKIHFQETNVLEMGLLINIKEDFIKLINLKNLLITNYYLVLDLLKNKLYIYYIFIGPLISILIIILIY